MDNRVYLVFAAFVFLVGIVSSISIDADYITIYPGEEGRVQIEVENDFSYDIEDVVVSLDLSEVPFSSIGSNSKKIDDLDTDDDDSTSFTLKANTEIIPGDYSIPYTVKYTNLDTDDEEDFSGSFGIRVSAKTELDFSIETSIDSYVGEEGRIIFEIINRGLGEIRSVSVQVYPENFELFSKDKIFIGTIDSDDSDIASFDVLFKEKSGIFRADVLFKDFENNEVTKSVALPFSILTKEEAIEKGLIQKSNSQFYLILILVIVVLFYFYRRRKKKKNSKNKKN